MASSDVSQKVVFRPQARLLSLLGEQLISDQAVGVIELVKNAYDADATQVQIILEGLLATKSTRIVIRDNGFGMTREDVEKKWLSPAINHKEKQKKKGQRTPYGRLPIGEKGVGRFAVQQLGHKFQLISRSKGALEVVVEINWDDFDKEDAFLSDIGILLYERDPVVFSGELTGTFLRIENARTQWNEQLVAKVQRALRRLQSPHQGSTQIDFKVEFTCSDFPAYQNISNSDILEHAHYIFDGMVTDAGTLDYEYVCRHPAVKERVYPEEGFDLIPLAKNELSDPENNSSGPFYVKFYVWDRTPEYLQQSDVSRADLDAMAGVSVFRDRLRVLPYGEPGNDWLDLDKERINAMSTRIGNQQIIGFVEVLQQDTPGLKDKTNREGLIDNPAFQDLRALVRASINVFLTLWREDRKKLEKPQKTPKAPPAKDSLDKAQTLARKLEESSRDDIVLKVEEQSPPSTYAADDGHFTSIEFKIIETPPVSDDHKTARSDDTMEVVKDHQIVPSESQPIAANLEPVVIELTQRQAMKQLLNHIKEASDYQNHNEADVEKQMQLLMHLASTGIAAERVAHEFGRQVGAAIDALGSLQKSAKNSHEYEDAMRTLKVCLGTLRNEFRVLAPYEAGWRSQRTISVSIRESVMLALDLNKYLIDSTKISTEIEDGDFEVRARPSSLVQVLDNLIYNSCTWLEHWQGERSIVVEIDANRHTVSVTDTGPGIPLNMREEVFEPFVSLRNGGRGLGLYITRELLRAMKGSIELETTRNCQGTRFLLQFPNESM